MKRLGERVWLTLFFCVGIMGALFTGVAAADEERTLMIKNNVFLPNEIHVPPNTPSILKVTNADVSAEEFESPSLNREKLIRGGGSVEIRLPALKPGRYEFYGEFHPDSARGVLIVE